VELRHLRYFVAVAEELHFSRAAARLHIAQPPLSQQIRQLEVELGVALFHRAKRRVALTEAGRVFLEETYRTLAQAEQACRAAQRAQRGEVGRLVVGFVGSASRHLVPAMLRSYRARYPHVEVVLHEVSTTAQVQALHEGRMHVGVLRPPVTSTLLTLEVISREPFIVVLPEGHRLAGFAQVPVSALREESFILCPRSTAPGFYDQVISFCHAAGFSPTVTQEAIDVHTIIDLIAGGMGVTLVAASVQGLRSEGVTYRPIENALPMVELALAWRADNVSPVVQAFLEVARESVDAAARRSAQA
jgi:DNA-binding transcriptional LysR family regulator